MYVIDQFHIQETMSLVNFFLTIAAAIGSASATSSRLTDVMSVAAGYEVQLHSNVTAYDVCMYLATGYQYNQLGTDKNITTEAYDDLDQGVARIITRHINDEYDNTTEALDTYKKTQRVVNFDLVNCKDVTDDEVMGWFSLTEEGKTRELKRGRRDSARNTRCYNQGQNCRTSEGTLDVSMCMIQNAPSGTSCGCAEYGTSAAACQTSYLQGTVWWTDQHHNWGGVTALQIRFRGAWGRNHLRLVGFMNTWNDYY